MKTRQELTAALREAGVELIPEEADQVLAFGSVLAARLGQPIGVLISSSMIGFRPDSSEVIVGETEVTTRTREQPGRERPDPADGDRARDDRSGARHPVGGRDRGESEVPGQAGGATEAEGRSRRTLIVRGRDGSFFGCLADEVRSIRSAFLGVYHGPERDERRYDHSSTDIVFKSGDSQRVQVPPAEIARALWGGP